MPSPKKNNPTYDFFTVIINNVTDFGCIGGYMKQLVGLTYSNDAPEFQQMLRFQGYGKQKQHAHAGKLVKNVQDKDLPEIKTLAGKMEKEHDRFLTDPRTEGYPGMRGYLRLFDTILNDSINGLDTYGDMLQIPGHIRCFELPDLRDSHAVTKEPFTAKQFDDFLVGMHYPELFENVLERTRLIQEMRGRELSPEERKVYSDRIIECNNKRREILEYQMTPEAEQKYSGYYQKYADTINGPRGNRLPIRFIDLENRLLQNGWDPATVQDVPVMIKQYTQFCRTASILEGLNEPGLADLTKICKEFKELDPEKQTFSDPGEEIAFTEKFAQKTEQFLKAVHRPEIQKLIEKNMDVIVPEEYHSKDEKVRFRDLSEVHTDQYYHSDANYDTYEMAATALIVGKSDVVMTERVTDSLEEIVRSARERLKTFTETLDGQRSKNSAYYTNMRDALEQVALLSEASTPDMIHQSLEALQKTSETYIKERSGSFKSEQGQSRLDMAADLVKDAQKGIQKFEAAAQASKAVSAHPEKSLVSAYMTSMRAAGDPHSRMERGYTAAFVKQAYSAIRSVKEPLQFLLRDSDDRKNRKVGVSDSYQQLSDAVDALYSQKDTLNANPEQLIKAYRTAIAAADQYTKKHTGAGHMFSGNDKKGKARVEASRLISETLKERLADLEATYAQLPAYGTTETPFERFDDMDQLAPGISKGYIPRSPDRINKYLNATIEGAQKQLRTVLDGDAPADEQAFQRKKNAASEHITTIAAANALREWVTAGKTIGNTSGMLHVMKQKMPTRKEFRAVIQGADNWEKLVELGEKACTEDAIGLTAELAKHRSPEEIKNQFGAPAPEKQIEKKHQKGK